MDRQEILKILKHDVAAAKEKVDAANQTFDAVIREAPSGLPHPDGVQRIHNASRELSSARQEFVEAHVRLTAFLSQGIVLNRLKKDIDQ